MAKKVLAVQKYLREYGLEKFLKEFKIKNQIAAEFANYADSTLATTYAAFLVTK